MAGLEGYMAGLEGYMAGLEGYMGWKGGNGPSLKSFAGSVINRYDIALESGMPEGCMSAPSPGIGDLCCPTSTDRPQAVL